MWELHKWSANHDKVQFGLRGKVKNFDYEWLSKKVKAIVSGLDEKVNVRFSLIAAIANLINMKQ